MLSPRGTGRIRQFRAGLLNFSQGHRGASEVELGGITLIGLQVGPCEASQRLQTTMPVSRIWNNPAVRREPKLTNRGRSHTVADMSTKRVNVVVAMFVLMLAISAGVFAQEPAPPTSSDRCAVCGMYVVNFPNWVGTIILTDGSQVFFDGPKDLFKYLLNLEKHDKNPQDISKIFVTDYYRVQMIDARKAFFVIGSDVMGPMGPELVPFSTKEESETFVRDHSGERVLLFDEISMENVPK
jgi:nitrous oxide reductase accessory protein NosL